MSHVIGPESASNGIPYTGTLGTCTARIPFLPTLRIMQDILPVSQHFPDKSRILKGKLLINELSFWYYYATFKSACQTRNYVCAFVHAQGVCVCTRLCQYAKISMPLTLQHTAKELFCMWKYSNIIQTFTASPSADKSPDALEKDGFCLNALALH